MGNLHAHATPFLYKNFFSRVISYIIPSRWKKYHSLKTRIRIHVFWVLVQTFYEHRTDLDWAGNAQEVVCLPAASLLALVLRHPLL